MDRKIIQREAWRPVGGRIAHFHSNWKQISSDHWLLDTVSGYRVEFDGHPPQGRAPMRIQLDAQKTKAMTEEVKELAAKGAIQRASSTGGFTSSMFLVPKSDGSWRPVINLKALNRHVITRHFKMESIRTVKGLMMKGDWLLKLDLKDAYLAVPIHQAHREFLKFQWQDQLWQFQALPFGLSSAPCVFTKLLKPVVSTLRKLGIRLVLYLDDMLIMAKHREEAKSHLATIMDLLLSLGFIINLKKSVLSPTQELEFLGFVLRSREMTIALPTQKLLTLKKTAKRMMEREETTIQDLACLVGMMVAAHPGILPAPLYYRQLEMAKSKAIRRGLSYDSKIQVNTDMKSDLAWWVHRASSHNGRCLQITQWDLMIESDASLKGWGASCEGSNTGGPWTFQEKSHHINYLELLAAFLALKSFASRRRVTSILLRLDNVTAIAFINRMGGTHSRLLSDLAVKIWNWSIERGITIHAEHLPGRYNIRADWESRHTADSTDWRLQREIFLQLQAKVGPFTIDLFASRTNTQLSRYCSWRPDPEAVAVDALSIPWRDHYPYMFPPFALIPQCLNKLGKEEVSAILIAPVWSNQVWFPLILRSLVDYPILLPPLPDIVISPEGRTHPLVLEGHFPLAAWPVSGNPSAQRDFQRELSVSSGSHGDLRRSHHIHPPGDSGIAGVLHGALIHFQLL